jgi:4-amino-4-deoxy-L-arabinose transferase-like glycosyltransferase
LSGNKRLALIGGLLVSGLAPILVAALPTSPLRLVWALFLICFIPGIALIEGLFALRPDAESPGGGERLLLGLGASYGVTIAGGLGLYYVLGQLTLFSLLALYTVVSLTGFGLALWVPGGRSGTSPGLQGIDRRNLALLLALLIFAAYFRFYYLSYSDFRGDEAEVVLRAVAAIRGEGQPILSHTKGPAETVISAAVGLLYGAFDELTARIPFSLGNWLAVAATYLLGHRLFGRRVALVAGGLVAINGWFITYGRTAQYQNLVLPMSILAVWGYVRFYQGGSHRYHVLGSLFLATATYGHYEGASAAPALVYLLVLGLMRRGIWKRQTGQSVRRSLRSMWPVALSLLLGAAIALAFYLPFILNPTVAGAQDHLAKRFGGSPPYNNWDAFYVNGLFYNSIYYIVSVGALLLLGTLLGTHQSLGSRRWGLAATFSTIPVLLLSWTGLLPVWYAPLVYLGLMGLFLLSPRVSVPVKTNLLWLLLPFGLYLFIVERPGNHYYVFMPPLTLLAALTLDRAWRWLRVWPSPGRQLAVPATAALLVAVFGLSTWHQHLVFLRTDLEYLLTYPRHHQPVFWSDPRYPFDIRIGWGFPYRLGWQTVSEMYRRGELAGDWYSTDENNSIFWYTQGRTRNPCYPRYFMLTEIGYHEPALEVPLDVIERHYALRATVQVNHQPRLRLYEFAPLGREQEPALYDEPTRYSTLYRPDMLAGDPLSGPVFSPSVRLTPTRHFKPHPDMLARLVEVYDDARITQLKDEVSLEGYDLDETWARPGGVLLLTLYWETDVSVVLPYKVFAHLEDSQLWAQADDEPGCGQFPTYRWRAGERVIDRHAIFLPDDLPAGDYPLKIGLYEARSGLRMDLLDEAGQPAGNALTLPSVSISQPLGEAAVDKIP